MKCICGIVFTLMSLISYSQDSVRVKEKISYVSLGLGLGLDYGGLGGRLTVMPIKYFGIFGGYGFALAGAGYNVGANVVFNPNRKVETYFTGMYGYNAAIVTKGVQKYSNLYYGPSFGFGLKINSRRSPDYFNLEVLLPIRDPAFQEKIDDLKNQGYKMSSVLPITISLGFHVRM